MSALPGLAILLLATIGAARVVKVSLVAMRRVALALRRACRRTPRAATVDAQALVNALADMIEARAARRTALACEIAGRSPAPEPSDTVIDMPRARR